MVGFVSEQTKIGKEILVYNRMSSDVVWIEIELAAVGKDKCWALTPPER